MLLTKSEARGTDAAGFWATEIGNDGKILYHKEPVSSSHFVKNDIWKQAGNCPLDMLLAHARGASKGSGVPSCNINNHPFLNSDKSLALIHNGKVEDYEYHALIQKYEVKSKCDSEIILRILEAAKENPDYPRRISGILDVFSLINYGHMACAVGERISDGTRFLWLFRNKHRPLWIVDLRNYLGQVFFVSEPNIWKESVSELKHSKHIFKSQKLIEIPSEEIWLFTIDIANRHPTGVQRFEISKESSIPWVFDGEYHKILHKNQDNEIITNLSENDDLICKKQTKTPPLEVYNPLSIIDLETKCKKIKDSIDSIYIAAQQALEESSLSNADFEQLLDLLDSQDRSLVEMESLLR